MQKNSEGYNADYSSGKNNGNFRYPHGITRGEYASTTGNLRQQQIGNIMTELLTPYSHKVDVSEINGHGADIIVYDKDARLVAKFEVKNENVTSYFDYNELGRICNNLRDAPTYGVICSFGKIIDKEVNANESLSYWFDDGCLELGYQTLPESYHRWYVAKNQVYKRKSNSPKSDRNLKLQIKCYLNRLGLIPKTDLVKCIKRHVCSYINKIIKSLSNVTSSIGSSLHDTRGSTYFMKILGRAKVMIDRVRGRKEGLPAPQANILNDRHKSDWDSRKLCVKVTRITGENKKIRSEDFEYSNSNG